MSACLVGSLAQAQAGFALPRWLEEDVISRITISGYRRLAYRNHYVSGDQDAFGYGNYGGRGDQNFTDFGHVRIEGRKVFGAVNFDFNIQDSRFQDPQSQRFNIDYETGPWSVDLGDIRGSLLNTNRFARFNKSLRGGSLAYTAGGFSAKAIYSEVRGAPKTVSLNGTNSAGPYFLQSAQIVRGSEIIEVDGVRQRLGEDYTINYEIGSVTFVNRTTLESKIISPTSTIVATYEVFGFSGSSGNVEGVGLSYDVAGIARLGLTAMQQNVGSAGGLSTRLEKFQGFGPAQTPYFLQFEPLETEPVVIRVDGIIQTQDIDFYFDSDNSSIFFFNRFMPSTSDIDVLYTPKPTRTVNGDREAIGWDLRVPLGRGGESGVLTYSEATGRLMNTPTPSSGTARGVDIRYETGPLEVIASTRNVPSGYVNIETIGFSRNELASDARLTFKANPFTTLSTNYSNASIVSRTVNGSGDTVFLNSRFTQLAGSYSTSPLGALPWTFDHGRTRSRNSLGETRIDRSELGTSFVGNRWDARVSLEHQDASGPTSATEQATVSINSLSLKSGYRPTSALTLSLNTSLSQIRSEGESGTGRDVQAAAIWKPTDKFDMRLVLQDSDSGKLATLGQFSSGYGAGFNGNGFSSGTGSSSFVGGSKVRSYILTSNYTLSADLSLGFRSFLRESSGSFGSNTETTGVGLDVDWTMNDAMSLRSSIDSSHTSFLGTGISSQNTVISSYLDGALGLWSWHAGLSALLSSGGGFSQDSLTYDTSVGFRLADRQSVSLFVYNTSSTGDFAQDDMDISLGYEYQIWRSVALRLAYRTREVANLDPLATSGAYRSSGFDIELIFNFGS